MDDNAYCIMHDAGITKILLARLGENRVWGWGSAGPFLKIILKRAKPLAPYTFCSYYEVVNFMILRDSDMFNPYFWAFKPSK